MLGDLSLSCNGILISHLCAVFLNCQHRACWRSLLCPVPLWGLRACSVLSTPVLCTTEPCVLQVSGSVNRTRVTSRELQRGCGSTLRKKEKLRGWCSHVMATSSEQIRPFTVVLQAFRLWIQKAAGRSSPWVESSVEVFEVQLHFFSPLLLLLKKEEYCYVAIVIYFKPQKTNNLEKGMRGTCFLSVAGNGGSDCSPSPWVL